MTFKVGLSSMWCTEIDKKIIPAIFLAFFSMYSFNYVISHNFQAGEEKLWQNKGYEEKYAKYHVLCLLQLRGRYKKKDVLVEIVNKFTDNNS
jgi:hypothetical protein